MDPDQTLKEARVLRHETDAQTEHRDIDENADRAARAKASAFLDGLMMSELVRVLYEAPQGYVGRQEVSWNPGEAANTVVDK